jgi:hypothetical protein
MDETEQIRGIHDGGVHRVSADGLEPLQYATRQIAADEEEFVIPDL